MTNQIPDKIKELANDPKIYEVIERIGEKFSLHIDQMGELDAEVRRIILGLSKSEDFVKNVAHLLEIDPGKASSITTELNKEIFSAIKQSMQDRETQAQPLSSDNSAIERAGNFEVEKEVPEKEETKSIDTDVIMQHIEKESPAVPNNLPTGESVPDNHTEPLIDHLLSQPNSTPIEKIEVKPEEMTKAKPGPEAKSEANPTKPSGPDPYREPIK